MNDAPDPAEPPVNDPPPKSRIPIAGGFLLGAASWLATLLPLKNYGGATFLIFSCFALPVIAVVLAIIPKTRRWGLGLLIACGIGWLVLGAICGGLLR